MHPNFKKALDNGQIKASVLTDGSPFVVYGTQYYQATENGFNLSIGRFHAFGDTLRRHDELKLTDELLTTALDSLESFFKRCRAHAGRDADQVLDAAGEGLVLVDRIKQRRGLGLSVEQVYEIASIFHFSEVEDPANVDSNQNRQKINDWLECEQKTEIWSFFLRSPLSSYLPLTGLSDTNTLSYLRELNVGEVLDWTRTLLSLKTSGASSATMNTIELRRETLYALDGLYHDLLRNISTSVVPGSEPSSENK